MTASPLFSLARGKRFFLASSSPRRKELLESVAIPFQILRPDDSEPEASPGEDPFSFAARAAMAKACACLKFMSGKASFLILAADTIVCLDGEIMGKPKSPARAYSMLRKLSGRAHQVVSGAALLWDEDGAILKDAFTETTNVTFYSWPDEILKNYAQSGEPLDKAGAYAIQGRGAFLAQSVDGSWTNVVGLPLSLLIQRLLKLNLLFPAA